MAKDIDSSTWDSICTLTLKCYDTYALQFGTRQSSFRGEETEKNSLNGCKEKLFTFYVFTFEVTKVSGMTWLEENLSRAYFYLSYISLVMIDKTNMQYIDIWRKQEILKVR